MKVNSGIALSHDPALSGARGINIRHLESFPPQECWPAAVLSNVVLCRTRLQVRCSMIDHDQGSSSRMALAASRHPAIPVKSRQPMWLALGIVVGF
jgi:hypothetical protein